MASLTDTLRELLTLDGALCAAVVDSDSGMMLAEAGTGLDLEIASAGNTEVMRAKLRTIKALGLDDTIDDILVTLSSQYHIIRPLEQNADVFIYLVLDRGRANLAMARLKVKWADASITLS